MTSLHSKIELWLVIKNSETLTWIKTSSQWVPMVLCKAHRKFMGKTWKQKRAKIVSCFQKHRGIRTFHKKIFHHFNGKLYPHRTKKNKKTLWDKQYNPFWKWTVKKIWLKQTNCRSNWETKVYLEFKMLLKSIPRQFKTLLPLQSRSIPIQTWIYMIHNHLRILPQQYSI